MQEFHEEIGYVEKEDFVIWPHRWCNEKGIDELIQYANRTNKKIIVTSSGPAKDCGTNLPRNIEFKFNLTKKEYFTLMAKARWYLSTCYQETFGYTIQEAIFFNCNILVPNRACCPEMVPSVNVYDKVEDIDFLFDSVDLTVPFEWTAKWDNNAQTMIDIIKSEK
jgi:glycosyltransferase involved in cell wall biosynthesis